MFQSARNLMQSRQEILDHDRRLLDSVCSTDKTISEAWREISSLESDIVRYYACEEFLQGVVGDGKVENECGSRIVFLRKNLRISLACFEEGYKNLDIRVQFENIPEFPDSILWPSPVEASDEEKAIAQYITALQHNEPASKLMDLRLTLSSIEFNDAPSCAKWLFYWLVIRPGDFINRRSDLVYWEAQLSELEKVRVKASECLMTQWVRAIDTLRDFRFGVYLKLQLFGLPVLLGNNRNWCNAEDVFQQAQLD